MLSISKKLPVQQLLCGNNGHSYVDNQCEYCHVKRDDWEEMEQEYNDQHRAVEFDQEATKLNRKNTHSDALSEAYNDDPKYTAKYE